MMVVGLTGGIASGKSTVAAMLRNANIPVIDADELALHITKQDEYLREIARVFGNEVLHDDGSLNRKKLAKIVFDDKSLLRKLELILHPKIEELRLKKLQELQKANVQVAVYMAPLIFEANIEKSLDKTILIIANSDLVRDRIRMRDGLSLEEAQKRIDAQMADKEKMKRADCVIENNGSLDELYKNLRLCWNQLTNISLPDKMKE